MKKMERPQTIPPCARLELTPWEKKDPLYPRLPGFLKQSIRLSCGDTVKDEAIDNIIAAVDKGEMLCWKILGYEESGNEFFVGFLTTAIMVDRIMCCTDLRIGAADIFEGISEELWQSAFETLLQYAKDNGCEVITSDIINERMIDRMKTLGFFAVSCRMLREV